MTEPFDAVDVIIAKRDGARLSDACLLYTSPSPRD